MKYSLSELMHRVLELLDENEKLIEERMEFGEACADLRDLIRVVIPGVARDVILDATLHQIDDCRHTDTKPVPTACGEGVYRLPLPEGFLRLVNFRMNLWPRGVKSPLAWGGEAHLLRNMKLAGRPRRAPAVVINCRGDRSELEIFGAESGDFVAEFDYLEEPVIVGGFIELPPRQVAEICDKTAEKISALSKNYN
ncbi:MAG: hypothetical protein K2M87_04700 [Muribaculaceae bacterium]|nr:hypothetical protein [Muribaculaceae bacterium]